MPVDSPLRHLAAECLSFGPGKRDAPHFATARERVQKLINQHFKKP